MEATEAEATEAEATEAEATEAEATEAEATVPIQKKHCTTIIVQYYTSEDLHLFSPFG